MRHVTVQEASFGPPVLAFTGLKLSRDSPPAFKPFIQADCSYGSSRSFEKGKEDGDGGPEHVEGEIFQAGQEGVVLLSENVDEEFLDHGKHQHGHEAVPPMVERKSSSEDRGIADEGVHALVSHVR
jgi:hypothetical protein